MRKAKGLYPKEEITFSFQGDPYDCIRQIVKNVAMHWMTRRPISTGVVAKSLRRGTDLR